MERLGAKKDPPLSTAYAWSRGDMISLGGRYLPAEDGKGTTDTVRLPGGTAVPSKEHDPVAEVAALFGRKDGTELMLHFFWVFSLGKSKTAADADTVGVANDASWSGIEIAHEKIGRLSAHAGDLKELLHSPWDFSAIVGKEHLASQNDIPGLVLIESAGVHQFLYMTDIGACHGFQGRIGIKKCRSNEIDPGVGTLGGEPNGDHEFIVLPIMKSAGSVRIEVLQDLDDGIYFFFQWEPPLRLFFILSRKDPDRKMRFRKRGSRPSVRILRMRSFARERYR